MADTNWLHFTQTPKRKRAELACIACHSKKVRCDLQSQIRRDLNTCSNCEAAGKECRPRISKREKGRQTKDRGHVVPPPAPHYRPRPQSGNREGPPELSQPPPQPVSNTYQDFNGLTQLTAAETPSRSVGSTATRSPGPSRNDRNSVLSSSWSKNWRSAENGRPVSSAVDPGFLRVYGPDHIENARDQMLSQRRSKTEVNILPVDLRQSFAETYFEYCFAWCPVLDRSTLFDDLARSPLLDNALALVGSHLRPPMILKVEPASYYDRVRWYFYDDLEEDLITSLQAVSLFYWWAPHAPSTVHRHSSWWWTSVVIRHAQQANFHQESDSDLSRTDINFLLRRRIWWTAFARERLTALCQGKPCLINPEDCDMPEPSLTDFPELENKTKAEVYIYWVRLCTIAGRAAKDLARSSKTPGPRRFPSHLARELIGWVQSLPVHLQLPIGMKHTPNFSMDVHQLHLPYLAMVVVLNLTQTSQSLPQARPPATLAASCIARILKDVLIRSSVRFLMPITCWYSGMAFIALLHASNTEHLKDSANADLEILHLTVKELRKMWGTADVFDRGFIRLLANRDAGTSDTAANGEAGPGLTASGLNHDLHNDSIQGTDDDIVWMDYFPFLTAETSPVAEKILGQQDENLNFWDDVCDPSIFNVPGLFEGLESFTDPKHFFPLNQDWPQM